MPRRTAGKAVKPKRPKKQQDAYCTYIIEITDFKIRYSFAVNRNKPRDPGPFSEYGAIDINGKLIFPDKLNETIVSCTIYSRRDYDDCLANPEKFVDYDPISVGSLTLRKDHRDFCGWLPFSGFPMVGQLLQAGYYRYLDLYGKAPYRGYSGIVSMGFLKEFDPEEY